MIIMITLNDLMHKVLGLFPDAIIEEDQDGQIVINTGLTFDQNFRLVPMEEEDD